jgi:hypothetical protein
MTTRQQLSPTALAVYSYLRAQADETGIVAASRSKVADSVGCCRYSVRKSLVILEKAGLLQVVPTVGEGGQTLSNTVRLIDAEG